MSLAMPRLNDVWWLVSKLFNKPNVDHIKQLAATLLGQWVVVNQWLAQASRTRYPLAMMVLRGPSECIFMEVLNRDG